MSFFVIINIEVTMQFKLLNYHKTLSNFATNLVGAFIPLVIYKATNSLYLAIIYLTFQCVSRVICNYIFKNAYNKYPQLFLMLRIIPLTIYNIFLLFLQTNLVVSLIFITICYGMNLSFKNNATEILFNYSTSTKSKNNLLITRVMENISVIVASLSGGLFLDLNPTALIIISLVLYFISVVPIFVFYFANRKNSSFNKDFVSNAVLAYKNDETMSKKSFKLSKSIITNYFIIYMLFCVVDNFTNFYTLNLFINVPTFAKAGYITAIYQFASMIGNIGISFLSKKMDVYIVGSISAVVLGVTAVVIPLLTNYIGIYALFMIFGITYGACSYYMMSSMMSKSRIAGVTNSTLFARQNGIMSGQIIGSLFILITGNIYPAFILMFIALIIYAIYVPISEEKMRNKIVNYLHNNEIE